MKLIRSIWLSSSVHVRTGSAGVYVGRLLQWTCHVAGERQSLCIYPLLAQRGDSGRAFRSMLIVAMELAPRQEAVLLQSLWGFVVDVICSDRLGVPNLGVRSRRQLSLP